MIYYNNVLLRTHGPYHKSTKGGLLYIIAHYRTHDQHWEGQSTLSSPQLYRLRKSTENG